MLITAPLSLLLGLVFAPLGETTLTSEIVPEFVHWQENADDLEQRLARLTVELEDQLESAHIVGMAIAIVKGDEVVYSQGFGLADRESGREVTPETIFAIGSSTKAFTSATIATLVDEGKMDWEDPVTEYLPDFELQIDAEGMSDEEAVVTLRDLMSHRTGFTRMGVLWAAGLADREMILETAIDAQPWSPFRKKFFYNNVMFLAAGEASAVAADQSWDELVTARILEPLGMSSSNTTTEEAQADERLALGYKWDEDKEVFVRDQMRVLNSIAPAGSINSNVLDMAQWLRLQLGRGEVDGKRLISTERLEQTWAPNIEVGGGMEYGMGWFIESWNGKRVIQHGGNIDGFAATCAFMPDDDLGFVLLSNVGMSTLQDASRSIVWDALLGSLGEAELEGDSAPAEDLTPFVGTYMANFGSFHDEAFEILVQDGHLALDIPSQQVFELLALGEDGRRDFALAPGVMAVSFLRGDDDEVTNIVLHQSGLSFEAPREGFVPEPDGTMQEFSRYFGTYEHPELPQPITVRYSGGRLECDIPGQMVFPMRLPNEEGIWHFRATDMIGLKFNEDEDGEVTSVTFHERGTKTECPLLSREAVAIPTLEEFLALRDSDAVAAKVDHLGVLRFSGKLALIHSGIVGTTKVTSRSGKGVLTENSLGDFGWGNEGANEVTAWSTSSFDVPEEFKGYRMDVMRLSSPLVYVDDLRRHYDKLSVVSAGEVDGREQVVVRLEKGDMPAWIGHFDGETGDLVRLEAKIIAPGIGAIPQEIEMSDYREVNGLRIPFHIENSNPMAGRTVVTYDSFEVGLALPAGFFDPKKD